MACLNWLRADDADASGANYTEGKLMRSMLFMIPLFGMVAGCYVVPPEGKVPAPDESTPSMRPVPLPDEWASQEAPAIEPDPLAPQISAISEITMPGETLAITGADLKGATLRIWAGDDLVEVEPLIALDDRMTAVVPESFPVSTMLVWPVRDGRHGTPVRVNGATAWWRWPERIPAQQNDVHLYVMGKNLHVGEGQPRVYLEGGEVSEWLVPLEVNPYQLRVVLPPLAAGDYTLRAHNGRGGVYGLSEPLPFTVFPEKERSGGGEVDVTTFGAVPDNGQDDHAAITAAIEAVAGQGGGTVYFPEGTYTLHAPLEIAADHIQLRGAGMGDYTAGAESPHGRFTLLTYADPDKIPPMLIRVNGRHVTIEDMTLVNGHDGRDQHVIGVYQPDATLRALRIIMFDRRDWGYAEPGPPLNRSATRRPPPYARGRIDTGALMIDTEGRADVRFTDSEVHAAGPGLQIGRFSGWHTSVSQPAAESVWVERVAFRGYYAGEPSGESDSAASGRATGVVIYSGRRVAVQHCSFAGADRSRARTMGRTVLVFNTSSHQLYFAHNDSRDVGPHPSAIGMNENQGEQYLIHYRYPHGGLFDVTSADHRKVNITTANIKSFEEQPPDAALIQALRGRNWDLSRPHFHFDPRGGQVLKEVGTHRSWILFVAAGRGVGQFREITRAEPVQDGYQFTLARPWRVPPDAGSRVVLMPAYRHVVLYKNFVDTGTLIETHKTHGVCFWFDAFDNVVDGNTFRNLTSGIVFNSRFRAPTGWNTTRNNLIEHVAGYPGDTSETAAGYVDHFRVTIQWPAAEDRVWYQVGNVARGNTIRHAEVGAYLHTRYTGLVGARKPPVEPHPDGGVVLSVIERNTFEEVEQGIVLSSPVNTAVIRQNHISLSAGAAYPSVRKQDDAATIIHSVVED